jgi:hypothetical protein
MRVAGVMSGTSLDGIMGSHGGRRDGRTPLRAASWRSNDESGGQWRV